MRFRGFASNGPKCGLWLEHDEPTVRYPDLVDVPLEVTEYFEVGAIVPVSHEYVYFPFIIGGVAVEPGCWRLTSA